MAGKVAAKLGNFLGSLGVDWKCQNCGQRSYINEYKGNIVDGTAQCPKCGLSPIKQLPNPAPEKQTGGVNAFKSLWRCIYDTVVPLPPPCAPAKSCLLLETPGFTINPDSYNPDKFDPSTMRSPDYAIFQMADRVPALAPYFYDTSSHISFHWKQLLDTFTITENPEDQQALKESYDKAIEILYGGQEGYQKQQKTEFFQKLDTLREAWKSAQEKHGNFRRECQKGSEKRSWPNNYLQGVGPYADEVKAALTDFNNLRAEIAKYQADISRYTRGDLRTQLVDQQQVMDQNKLYNAGDGGNADEFYKTSFDPDDWWKFFSEAKDDEGWKPVKVTQEQLYSARSHEIFMTLSGALSTSNAGLELPKSADHGKENFDLTTEDSNLEISFKIRKVSIIRPWLDTKLLEYPKLGINGKPASMWSTGALDPSKNKGEFPLLPTDMVLAKDIMIRADSITDKALKCISSGENTSMAIGCFSIGGSSQPGGLYDIDVDSKMITVKGTQIIGWVCSVIPNFPSSSDE